MEILIIPKTKLINLDSLLNICVIFLKYFWRVSNISYSINAFVGLDVCVGLYVCVRRCVCVL